MPYSGKTNSHQNSYKGQLSHSRAGAIIFFSGPQTLLINNIYFINKDSVVIKKQQFMTSNQVLYTCHWN